MMSKANHDYPSLDRPSDRLSTTMPPQADAPAPCKHLAHLRNMGIGYRVADAIGQGPYAPLAERRHWQGRLHQLATKRKFSSNERVPR